MVAFLYFSRDIGHLFGYSVVITGDTTAVWFVESFPAEGASFGDPFFLWYWSAVVVEFGDVGDGVGCVGGCFQFVVLDVVTS